MSNSYQFFRKLIEKGPENKRGKILFPILIAVSQLYALAVNLRLAAYQRGFFKSYKLSIPVISVGNLTVGGTGKTPVVDELVRRAVAAGKRVAIVSRGYGGKRKAGTALVADGRTLFRNQPDQYGDEPVLLARKNPEAVVIVARRRHEGALLAEKMGAEIAILDDGFQHLRLERDLDIVLLDSGNPFGNRRMLPAGPLREPVTSLQRADLMILTRFQGITPPEASFDKPVLTCRQVLSDHLESLDGETCGWQDLQGRPCVAFAGIASPHGFFDALRDQGLTLLAGIALQDHQKFNENLLRQLQEACREADFCLTTEKDAVKLKPGDLPVTCWSVSLEITIQPEDQLQKVLEQFFLKERPMELSKDLLNILACPKCKGDLELDQEQDRLICPFCQLAYPVRDNIPVMLIDEAEDLSVS